ncbi:MAG: YopX family protein [Acidobacteriota bacterium]|nr:YopX family protein [Acidobacteriota bacterium]
MKREIKFRAFSTKSGMWTWEKLTQGHPLSCLYSHPDGSWNVMQFTGLKDKNGVEIYEGDVLRMENYHGEIFIDDVQFRDGAFQVEVRDAEYDLTVIGWLDELDIKAEVIGNIYENAELLKTKAVTT